MLVICNKYKNCEHRCMHKYVHESKGNECNATTCASTQQKVCCDNKTIRREKLKKINESNL